MFLTGKYGSHLFPLISSNAKKPQHRSPSKPFEEALIFRLESLLTIPTPPPSTPISWLVLAVDLTSLTLSDAAAALVSDHPLSGADRSALASHLDAGVAFLDACNAISAQIDRLLRDRLLILFALHLLSSSHPPPPESVCRARECINEWEESRRRAIRGSASDLIRKLRPSDPPRGRISAVCRAIYAVEAVSSLVAGAVLAVLGGGEKVDLDGIRAPGEFPWAEAFNEVVAAVAGQIPGFVSEVVAVEERVRRLVAMIDGEDDGEKAERLRSAVEAAAEATEELTVGLERLSKSVSGLFRVALSTRKTALQSFRISPQECK